ncbi:hypothetical protein KR018_007622 [Drosophila ironensis]|nr:hypothetical protein KR018_007622 [Drosophila ironensis]
MENNMASGQGDAAPLMTFDVVLNALKALAKPVPLEDLVEYIESNLKCTPPNNCDVHRSIIRLLHYGLFVDYISIQNGLVTIAKAHQTGEDDHRDLAVNSSGSDRVIFHINSSSQSVQLTAAAADSIDSSSGDSGFFEICKDSSSAAMNASQVTLKNLYGSPSFRNVDQLAYTDSSSTNESQGSVHQMDPSGPPQDSQCCKVLPTINGGAYSSRQSLSNQSDWSTTAVCGSNPWLGPNRSQEWSQGSDMPLLSSSIALNLNCLAPSEQQLLFPTLSRASLPSRASSESNQDTSDTN